MWKKILRRKWDVQLLLPFIDYPGHTLYTDRHKHTLLLNIYLFIYKYEYIYIYAVCVCVKVTFVKVTGFITVKASLNVQQ